MDLNTLTSIAQIASPLVYVVFILALGLGYYYQFKATRESIREVRNEFQSGGRPVVAVHDEYESSSAYVNLAVQNVGNGPAKNVSFEFSRPIESSDGFVLSGLPLFKIGLTSLAPGGKITCYWDRLEDLMPYLRERGLTGEDFSVRVRYDDLTGTPYENDWDIQPAVYEGLRTVAHEDMNSLVNMLGKISRGEIAATEPQKGTNSTQRDGDRDD